MRVFVFDAFHVRRLTAVVPAAYLRILLESAKKPGPDELDSSITVEQTPYYDLGDAAGFRAVLAAMLDDDERMDRSPNVDTVSYREPRRSRKHVPAKAPALAKETTSEAR